MTVNGDGGAFDGGDGAGRWISYAALRVTTQVTSVQTAERRLVVPWHGRVVVVWPERQPQRLVALDEREGPSPRFGCSERRSQSRYRIDRRCGLTEAA